MENYYFIGVFSGGMKMAVRVRMDWDGNELPFGSSDHPQLRYCEYSSDPDEPNSYTNVFQCTSKLGQKPSVIYKRDEYPHTSAPIPMKKPRVNTVKMTGARGKEAMSYFQKAGLKNDEFHDYYVCYQGCNDKTPPFIFEYRHVTDD